MDEARSQIDQARATAQAVARSAYGRLVASLARRWGDLADAEDALSEAFERALTLWPRDGTPRNPEGWLLTTAHRRLIDARRRTQTRTRAEPDLIRQIEELSDAVSARDWPDDRLGLMLACAHPELSPDLHTPLMLQAVLGLDAARIGAAFLVSPAAMGQRLSRGKARLKAAGARFETPDQTALHSRLPPVLDTVYAAYGTGWDELGVEGSKVRGLADEAAFLSALLVELTTDIAEVHGLFALITHCEARTPARRNEDGSFIPLSDQDPTRWSMAHTERAEAALRKALSLGPPGRYTLEAAIQSVHAERRQTGATNWRAAAALYDQLVELAPSLGALTARASAYGEVWGAETALDHLAELQDQASLYQPWWAARAHWLKHARQTDLAREAYVKAMALSTDPSVRLFLEQQAQTL